MSTDDDPQRHAVVIGINDYADPAIPDLKYAESDARAVYDTLTDPDVGRFPQENVALLLGAQASPSAIRSALYHLRGVGRDDLVVVFYSGHGAKEGEEAYWVTQNAEARALPATALSNTDIRRFIDMIPSERLVILLDCCYAASTVKKDLADPGALFGKFAGKGRVTIAGAAENQEALEYAEKQSGVFSYFLVAGLRGAADANTDGVVTFEELWTYLGDNVRRTSVSQGGLHEPKIITEDGLTPRFLLTFNPTVRAANEQAVATLRQLFDRQEVTGAQYDAGYAALTQPALDSEEAARREVFADLVAGRLAPKYLADVLERRLNEVRGGEAAWPATEGSKPTLAVVPFDVLGDVRAADAGAILAERLLPYFADRYALIDQTRLRDFLRQDDLTAAGLAEIATRPTTKSLAKTIKLRAVRYLVVGTISGLPDGSLSVTARLCDWQTGGVEAGRIAQIGASDWTDLVRRLPLLAARLGGTLADLGTGAEAPQIALPGGIDGLVARARQLEALKAELDDALKSLTPKHPRVVQLQEQFDERGDPLKREIEQKIAELRAADAKLAAWYQPTCPQRLVISDQLATLDGLLHGGLWGFPPTLNLDLGDGVTVELVLIPAGEFLMGSPDSEVGRGNDETQHRVRISRPFYMGHYEVTVGQYRQFVRATAYVTDAERGGQAFEDGKRGGLGTVVDGYRWGENASWRDPGFAQGEDYPVVQVSWNDAKTFCDWLAGRTGRVVRLPSEAEWEYACRAGTDTVYWWGDDADTSGGVANLADRRFRAMYPSWSIMQIDDGYVHTAPVGTYRANGYGLHDMLGNVIEWCSDWYGAYSSSTGVDPTGPASGEERVLRGGAWTLAPAGCRSAVRVHFPDIRTNSAGFRVAAETN